MNNIKNSIEKFNNNLDLIKNEKKDLDLKNNAFEKLYRQELYNTLEKLYNLGLEFYSFTFMFNNFFENNPNIEIIKKLRWEQTYEYVEQFAGYWINKIPFVVFSYIAIETHEGVGPSKGFPHFHGIFAINPIIPNNGYKSFLNIKTTLTNIWNTDNNVDLKINYLNTWKDVYQSMNYVIKFMDLNKHFLYFYKNELTISKLSLPLTNFLHFLEAHQIEIQGMDDTFNTNKINQYKFNKLKFIENEKSLFFNHFINTRILDDKVILRILHIFMQLENLFIFNNNFYKKIPNSKAGYKFFKSLDDLLNNFDIITIRLLKEPDIQFHLEYTDFLGIIITYIESMKDKIIKNPKLSLPSITLYHNICEFKDGFYFMQFDYFLYFKFPKHKAIINMLHSKQLLNTSKYYKKTFHHLTEPTLWISSIKHTMDNDENEFKRFCKAFGMLMHQNDFESTKQDNVYIEGDTNTGKTSLVAEVLLHIYGEENVGLLSNNDDNFYLEQAIEKMIFICDEFVYKKKRRSDLLRLINRSPVLANRKYKRALYLRNVARSLFLANPDVNKDLLLDKAIESRLQFFQFRNFIASRHKGFIKDIKNEVPKILVYCNRLFIRSQMDTRVRLETFNKYFNLNEPPTSTSLIPPIGD